MPLLTQRQAIYDLRNATNMRWEWCVDSVKKLATVQDGKRWKLRDADLQRLITDTLYPPKPVAVKGVKPISVKKMRQIQERCI